MISKTNISFSNLLRKSATTLALLGVVSIAFASLGDGGGVKGKKKPATRPVVAVKAADFTLRNNFRYRGSKILSTEQDKKFVMYNTVVKYQKGNTIYVMPIKHKVPLSIFKTPTPVIR
jgi:hypothetical protein